MVTSNQKRSIGTQKLKTKELKYNTKENHQTTREETERRIEKNYKNNQRTSNKIALSTYLSIITLNIID